MIRLIKDTYIDGVKKTSGTILRYPSHFEKQLISSGMAVSVDAERVAKLASLPIRHGIGCVIGNSFANNYNGNAPITAYSKTSGAATIRCKTTSAIFTASQPIKVMGGRSLPPEYHTQDAEAFTKVTSATLGGGNTYLDVVYPISDQKSGSGTPNIGSAWAISVSPGGTGPGKSATTVPNWLQVLSNGGLHIPASYKLGLSGMTLVDNILPVLEETLDWWIRPVPSFAYIHAHTNDVTNIVAGTLTLDEVMEATRDLVARLRHRGIFPIVEGVWPNIAGSDYNNKARELNFLLSEESWRSGDFIFLDAWNVVSDPTSATGETRSGFTSDGTHPVSKGAFLAAQYYLNGPLSGLFARCDTGGYSQVDRYAVLKNPTGNLLSAAQSGFTSTSGPTTLNNTAQTVGVWQCKRDATGTGTITAEIKARTDKHPGTDVVVTGNEMVISYANTVSTSTFEMGLSTSPFWGRIIVGSASVSSGVVTVNATSHGMVTGDSVTASGYADNTLNGVNMLVTRVTDNQFTYTPSVAPADGSVTLGSGKMARSIGPGDQIYLEAEIAIDGITSISDMKPPALFFRLYDAAGVYAVSYANTAGTTGFPAVAWSGVLRTPSLPVPSNPQYLIPYLQLDGVVGDALVLHVRNIALRKESSRYPVDF